MSKPSNRPSAHTAGFTLVEIMAATAVMGALMLMVLSLVSYIMGAWNRSSDSLEASGRAQFAMDILEKDLGALEIRKTTQNYEFLRAITSNISGVPISGGLPSTRLIFLTSPVDSSDGAVQCVSYQVLYKNPLRKTGAGTPIFGLYRGKVTARATLANAYITKTQPSDPGLEQAFQSGNRTASGDTDDEVAASDPEASANLLVSNVMALRIIPYYWDDTTIRPFEGTLDNPRQITSGTFVIDAKNGASVIGGLTDKKVAYIDVIMILLTPEGAAMLRAIEDGHASDPSDWNEWLSQNTYTFSRRVPIQGQL